MVILLTKHPNMTDTPALIIFSVSLIPLEGSITQSPVRSFNLAPPRDLSPPALLMSSTANWIPFVAYHPNLEAGPERGLTHPISTSSGALPRMIFGKPREVVARPKVPAPHPFKNVLRLNLFVVFLSFMYPSFINEFPKGVISPYRL